jgi:hypothetical protein
MSSTPDPQPRLAPGLLDRARLPVAFLLVCVFALGGYYFFHVQRKSIYLMGRNFRLLATIGEGVRASLASYTKVFDSHFKGAGESPSLPPPDFSRCVGDPEVPNSAGHPAGEPIVILAEHPADHLIFIHFAGPFVREHATVGCDLALQTLLAPLFDSQEAFDTVLLVEPDGDVVYQRGGPELGVTHLPLDSGEPAQKAGGKAATTPSLPLLGSSVGDRNVVLGGREYKLFVEPLRLPIANPEGTAKPWFLCGIVAADKFVYKSLAVSSSLLLLIMTVLLLSVLSWPLLKLRLLGERQRVRLVDVLLIGTCSLLGVALMTLLLLDFYAYSEFKSTARRQLQGFASRMAKNVGDEVRVARQDLAILEKRAILTSPKGQEVSSPLSPSVLLTGSWHYFALVDSKGMQQVKWTPSGQPLLSTVDVRDRSYFKRALSSGTGFWSAGTKPASRFFVEPVTAWTTGIRQAVLSVPVTDPRLLSQGLAVATLAIPMRSVIEPLIPPGFEFAVIDDQGKVLFHSNSSRNGIEDFFAEADGDQRLRSAVFARHNEEMSIRYFGEDFLAAVRPVPTPGLPWTVVALRDKEQLRTLNMEWVVTAVIFLLLAACPFGLLLLTIVIARPGYRAPWIWPDSTRAAEYVNLTFLLALLALAFFLVIAYLSTPGQLLGTASSLPFLALLTSYIVLRRRPGEPVWRQVAGSYVGGLVLLIILLWALFPDRPDGFNLSDLVAAAVGLLVLSTCLLSLRRPAWWMRATRDVRLSAVRAYPLAGLMLLVLTTVLPMLCVFKVVHRLELYSFIRHGQLRLARGLTEHSRGNGLPGLAQDKAAPAVCKDPDVDVYGCTFFATHLVAETTIGPCESGAQEVPPIPELLEDLLPHYSMRATEMRELLHDRASDCSWDSHRILEDAMDLHSRGGTGDLHLRSQFPRLFVGTPREFAMAGFFGVQSGASSAAGSALSLGLIALFASLLYSLVLFISRRLFLVDLREPLWSHEEGVLKPTAGRNVFWVRKKPITREDATKAGFEYLHFEEVAPTIDAGGAEWAARRRALVDSDTRVLLAGFEHRLPDSRFNGEKLALLEDLIERSERSVVVCSSESPTRLFARGRREAARPVAAGSPDTEERWRVLLSSFTLIEEELRAGELLERLRSATESGDFLHPVLQTEGGNDPFLLEIASDLNGKNGMDREQLLEEFGERAEAYYRDVWESCSEGEKVVVQHLAAEGLVNEKNRRVIRRLMARGLVRRGPNFRLMNETFRRFARSSFCKAQVDDFEQTAAPSAWDRFRWPFLGVLSASLAFFFATQQELLDSAMAVVTGVTAGLPVLAKIVDLLGGKRPAAGKAG